MTNEIDWLHRNGMRSREDPQNLSPYLGMHGQENFLAKSAYLEKKRQRDTSEERYSLMTGGERDVRLQKNREYKKYIRGTKTPSDHDDIATVTATSHCTPKVQAQPSKNHRTGDTHSDEENDPTGIFEPIEEGAILEDNLDTIQEEQAMHAFDEECRIFSGQGDVFDSYTLKSDVATTNQNDDPYDSIYHNLPSKHHVLKPVKDYIHCGAMRFQYEGPARCRKGKVKIVIPEVPQELRRLSTSQVDEDAKYFKKHIRYFNTHFSFTSLGVNLDQKVSNAARTGVYTFRAQGGCIIRWKIWYWWSRTRHLQLHIYDR